MELLNRYQIIEKIGEGAFGETFLARKDDQKVVIKKLKLNQLDHWKGVERFQREADLMKQLSHPGIPKYIDFIQEEQFAAIVQEYIAGATLEEHLQKHPRKFTPHRIESILKQGLDILNYLESLSPPIIHRDISPKNLILTKENKLYLIDFGTVQKSYSDTVTCMGTFGYMAPEQLLGKATTQSDLFSFGMVLLRLITRKPLESLPTDSRTGKIRVDLVIKQQSSMVQKIVTKLVEPGQGKRFKNARQGLKHFDKPPRKEHLKDLSVHFLKSGKIYLQWLEIFPKEAGVDYLTLQNYLKYIFFPFIGTFTVLILSIPFSSMFGLLGLLLFLIPSILFGAPEFDKHIERTHPSDVQEPDHKQRVIECRSGVTRLYINNQFIQNWFAPPVIELEQRYRNLFHIYLTLTDDGYDDTYLIKTFNDVDKALLFKKELSDQLEKLHNKKIQTKRRYKDQ